LLPFPSLLVPLSAFFSTNKSEGRSYSRIEKDIIIKWFWRSVFARRYEAGVNPKQEKDITDFLNLKSDNQHSFKLPDATVKINFLEDNFYSCKRKFKNTYSIA
jgi:hypothetical protein